MKKASISNKISHFIGVGILIVTLLIPQVAHAADLSTFLVPEQDTGEVSYVGVRTVTLEYPAGSPLAQELNGQTHRVEFSLNGTATDQNNTGMSDLIAALNRAFIQAESPVQSSEAEVPIQEF